MQNCKKIKKIIKYLTNLGGYAIIYAKVIKMKISSRFDYAISCILRVADKYNEGPVKASEAAEKEKLKEDYVEQLFRAMRKKDILKSIRGPGGGYVLSRPSSHINCKDIMEAIEKNTFETVCFREKGRRNKCIHRNNCRIRSVWLEIKDGIEALFKRYDVGTLLRMRRTEKNWN
ncbi:hypothetical protein COY52_10995 [Candidatus Desantisbacteria bacterium CG_4_10_14_0_8_um_filter_48_22]|uniref:Rrf2 family transcriptional regulator n=1 Tax=Candidatus Desantisbacteria bacterium CG_4_10_14_0_8_um_filter_48_22 TaxID=1974543 RepID=A0A2M7S5H2_9BACT|nr:MAG: hypothetical protein COS16_01350 [Candidatus Desantisbacteria bacterium CG02_land_8_20_14_3_00_49_13]PIZ14787.1 MAG: hypothetical protein COY52_10995 [Candidatus Desantisbacteria bacterium CG_4_10_14_0_8_um_filter_48_22]